MPCTIFFLIYNLLIISSFIGCPRQRLFYKKLDINQIVIEILMIWLDIFSPLSVSSSYSKEIIIFLNNASKCSNSKKILGCFHIYLLNLQYTYICKCMLNFCIACGVLVHFANAQLYEAISCCVHVYISSCKH